MSLGLRFSALMTSVIMDLFFDEKVSNVMLKYPILIEKDLIYVA